MIRIAKGLYLEKGKFGKRIGVRRDGEKVPVELNIFAKKPYYITIGQNQRPENEEEAISRVGKDVVKLEPQELVEYSKRLGLLREITDEDIQKTCKIFTAFFFEAVFDSMDDFSPALTIKLTKEEWNSVKQYFRYDVDCEEWLTTNEHAKEIMYKLYQTSERFKTAITAATCDSMFRDDQLAHIIIDYVKLYSHKDNIEAYAGYSDWGMEEYKELLQKYGFTGKGEKIESHASISGYNLGTITLEQNNELFLIEETHALPPDDWEGNAVVIKNNTGNYWALFKIAEAKEWVENNPLFKRGLKYVEE